MEEEIASEYKRSSRNTVEGFLSKVSTGQIFIFIIILLVIVAMSNNESLDKKYNVVIYVGLIAIIAYLYFKPTKEKALLPEHIVKQIAQEALNRKVRDGQEFPFDSKVFVMPACHLKYESDLMTGTSGPVAWEVGFEELVRGSQFKREGVIRIHPFEGKVTGISFYPLGYSGRESRDKTIVPVGVVQGNVKTTDFGGGPGSQGNG